MLLFIHKAYILLVVFIFFVPSAQAQETDPGAMVGSVYIRHGHGRLRTRIGWDLEGIRVSLYFVKIFYVFGEIIKFRRVGKCAKMGVHTLVGLVHKNIISTGRLGKMGYLVIRKGKMGIT